MLEVDAISAGYGRIEVLRKVSLSVPEGAVVGVLGANGAGKTTLARTLSGLTQLKQGDIRFEGESLRRLKPEQIVSRGIIHVPQGRMLFPDLTVEENLEMGAYRSAAQRFINASRGRVYDYFPILSERRRQLAGVLSGGQQQMLAIGRALMARPRLLILDEPSLGLAPLIIRDIFEVIRMINSEGVSILVAEQNAKQVLKTAGTVHVLETGEIAITGSSDDPGLNDLIRRTYLGVSEPGT